MEFIVDNWLLIVIAISAIVVAVSMGIKFFKKDIDEQLKNVREWLLYAVSVAEKELGSGTGKLKLRYVYDMFVAKFTWLSKVISFEQFSNLVDEVLVEMNKLLDTNKAVQSYILGFNNDVEFYNSK